MQMVKLKLKEIILEFYVNHGAAALQFPLRNENVVTVTCGVQSVEQAQQNYDWAQWNISDLLWRDLADIE